MIAFLNICNVPVWPATVFGFASGYTRGRFFHIRDALRSLQRTTLMDGDMKMRVVNILNGIFGCDGKVLIKILIVGSLHVGGATSG